MYKKAVCLTIVLVILASIAAPTRLAATSWDPDTSNVTLEQYTLNRTAAFNQQSILYSGFERTSNRLIIYPCFYAGFHADVDGLLVISITESNLEQARSHGSIGPLLEAGVQYRFVEFSHEELWAVHSELWEAAMERYVPRRQRLWRRDWCRGLKDMYLTPQWWYLIQPSTSHSMAAALHGLVLYLRLHLWQVC
ncbi:MAG: hypothetical protein FWC92_03715 [Defluviitaleaceae bacterium]|nr:hypothetical protein [Defluviitaleaceae bacterium]